MSTRASEPAENAAADHCGGHRSTPITKLLFFLLMAALLISAACADTKQARTVDRLGFLKDLYPKMVDGNEDAGESLLIYKSPRIAQIPPNTYKKFMLDPVLVFRGPHSKM